MKASYPVNRSPGGAGTLAAVAVFTLAFALPPLARAAYNPSGQEQQAIAKLITDLATLRAGSQVSDAERQALAADFQVLATSITKPSQASVDQLTEDLTAALANGTLSATDQARLILDVDAVLNSAGLSTEQAQQFIADAQAVLASSGINSSDVQLITSDLAAVAAGIQINFVLTNASFALLPPAGGTASGQAQLASLTNADNTTATLALSALGLTTGNYQVNATTAAGGAPVKLGSFAVFGAAGKPGAGAAIFGSGFGTPFPNGFAPDSLAALSISDAGGATQLSGSVTSATKFTRQGNFRLVPGPAAPSAFGNVAFKVKTKSGATKSSFLLSAYQLPANATLTLKANGTPAGTVATDKKGRLVINAGNVVPPTKPDGVTPLVPPTPLPAGVDLNTLGFLELDDAQGQIVATAGIGS